MLYTNEAIQKRQRINRKIKNFSSIIVYVMVIPLLIYNISLIVQAVINPTQTPSFAGIKTYVIISGSMEPDFKIGDIVVAKNVEKEQLNVGDIVSFRQGQSIITHRITEIIKNRGDIEYKTKGDNNNTEDSGTITHKSIEGKVVARIPGFGKISLILQKKITIVIIIIAFYVYLIIVHSKRKKKNERKIKRIRYEKKSE